MKLQAYLRDNGLTQNQFINVCKEKTGVSFTQACVSKWVLQKRRPRAEECKAIYDSTEGMVTPNDFYL